MMWTYLCNYSDKIERYSVDECFLDYTNSGELFGNPIKTAYQIKEDIKKAENLFYKVAVKTKHGIHIFTSAEYFPLEKNIKYSFVVGRKSKVIVDVSAIPPPNTQTINSSSTTNPSSTIS